MRGKLVVAVLAVACAPAADPEVPTPDAPSVDTAPATPELEPLTDPGRVPMRRLTRAEYERTVSEIVGIPLAVQEDFPADDATEGFDTVAEGLAVSPLLVELYEREAAYVVQRIMERPLLVPVAQRFEPSELTVDSPSFHVDVDRASIYSPGSMSVGIDVPRAGVYRVGLLTYADQAGSELPLIEVTGGLGGRPTFEIEAGSAGEAMWKEVDLDLPKGRVVVTFQWSNDFYQPPPDRLDRNVHVQAARFEGPVPFVAEMNPAWDRIMVCDPDALDDPRPCIAGIVQTLASEAWRRPVEVGELADVLGIVDQVLDAGDPPMWALEFALRAVFASPHFVFLEEPVAPAAGLEPVDDHTLASRLSFGLWGSGPDAELRSLAGEGRLNDPDELARQVERMLDDPRARALSEDLAGQWLMIRAVDGPIPDSFTYPLFTEAVRTSMKASMLALFDDFVFDDLPLTDLLEGRYAYIDRPLAGVYDYPIVSFDDQLEKIEVGIDGRRGWLGQAGLLMATSYPERTSPVRRGVWVLSNLLCDEPPPPPPGVEGFPEASPSAATVRARLAAHRADPSCNACHQVIDPIGLAFEHFDGVGRYRDLDQGEPVDATGTLPGGVAVDGVASLADALVADRRFAPCVMEKTFTYLHRRGVADEDEPYLERALAAAQSEGFSLQAVITALVTSDTFRMHGSAR